MGNTHSHVDASETRVSLLDLVFVAAVAAGTAFGLRAGFVVRACSWAAVGVGVLVGFRLTPTVLDLIGPRHNVVFSVSLAVVFVCVLGAHVAGSALGRRFQRGLPDRYTKANAIGGGALALIGLVGIFYTALPSVRAEIDVVDNAAGSSLLLGTVAPGLGDGPSQEAVLRALTGDEAVVALAEGRDYRPVVALDLGPSGLARETVLETEPSVVRIAGVACGRLQRGTGLVVDDELIVTSAHVVSGDRSIEVFRDDGMAFEADLVAFDPARDIAALRVRDLDRRPLEFRSTQGRERGGVLGYAGEEVLRVTGFRLEALLTDRGLDIFGDDRVSRTVHRLSADLEPGDSGAPLVGADGKVLGLAFAVSTATDGTAYALTTDEIEAFVAEVGDGRHAADDTADRCLHSNG